MEKIEPNNCYNLDCNIGMQMMKEQGLIADWCITDPPYGIGIGKMSFTKQGAVRNGKAQALTRDYSQTNRQWDDERIGGGLHTTYKRGKQRADYIRRQLLYGYSTTDKELDCLG